jgi:hypothetical protein
MIMMESIETIWPSLPENEKQRIISEHTAVHQDLVAQNKLVGAYSLPRAGARTVRKDASGQFSVTDGPPGNELFGAVYVIVAVSIEEALEWGKKLRFLPGANEVREIFHN